MILELFGLNFCNPHLNLMDGRCRVLVIHLYRDVFSPYHRKELNLNQLINTSQANVAAGTLRLIKLS